MFLQPIQTEMLTKAEMRILKEVFFDELLRECHTAERHAIEDMLLRSAEYVHADAVAKVLAMNIAGRGDAEQNDKIRAANRTCAVNLEGLVYAVHVVNKICAKRGKPLLYQGEINHQGCADLAVQFVAKAISMRTEESEAWHTRSTCS